MCSVVRNCFASELLPKYLMRLASCHATLSLYVNRFLGFALDFILGLKPLLKIGNCLMVVAGDGVVGGVMGAVVIGVVSSVAVGVTVAINCFIAFGLSMSARMLRHRLRSLARVTICANVRSVGRPWYMSPARPCLYWILAASLTKRLPRRRKICPSHVNLLRFIAATKSYVRVFAFASMCASF